MPEPTPTERTPTVRSSIPAPCTTIAQAVVVNYLLSTGYSHLRGDRHRVRLEPPPDSSGGLNHVTVDKDGNIHFHLKELEAP